MQSVSHIFNLALQYHQAGDLRQAELLYRQVLQIDPRHADALHMLGVIHFQVGRHELAVQHIRSALEERPNLAAAHCNLGCSLQALGRLEEAVASFRQAVQFDPDHAEAHNNLGTALRLQNKLDEAAASFQQALRLRPSYVEALTNLGLALQKLGKLDGAVAHHEQALRLKPNLAEAHNNLGVVRQAQGKLDEAATSFQQALRLKPNYVEAHKNLARIRENQGKMDEALASLERALRLEPNSPAAGLELGSLLVSLGDSEGAEQAIRAVLRLDPRNVGALSLLSSLLGGKLPAADRAVLERRLAEPDLNDADRYRLLFSLANVCDGRDEYEQAAALLRQANALALAVRRAKGQGYDVAEHARFIENLMAGFTPAFFERVRGFGLETERPVFIVGLPRSGTTLIEQILAAHSQVFGAGELTLSRDDFLALGTQPTLPSSFAALPGLQRETVRLVAQRHLDQLRKLNGTAQRVVDKLPDNYLHLGLLAVLFPRAKFIHCRRDLRDVAVSCWMTNFRHFDWANDLEHIAARFWEYHRLMEHWQAVLPVSLLHVQYEETVADLPGVARRLVEWCGLDWEPTCLSFHESKRQIRTASVVQVRQPVHTKSVARWRNYERDLGPLFTALATLQDRR